MDTYERTITEEDNKKWLNSLNEEEKNNLILKTYRDFRNQKLKKTDILMQQFDRFSQKQMEELTTYRQQLRDMFNNDKIEFPIEPEFIRYVKKL